MSQAQPIVPPIAPRCTTILTSRRCCHPALIRDGQGRTFAEDLPRLERQQATIGTHPAPRLLSLNADVGGEKGYVMLQRRLDIGGKFTCTSRIYLQASRFGRLLRMAEKRVGNSNLKAVLASTFAAPTLQSDGLARLAPMDTPDARILGIAPGTIGLHVAITGRSFGRQPITFQHMCVPPTPYALKFNFNPPQSDDAEI